jgi:serine/threonine-protein kinase HipA
MTVSLTIQTYFDGRWHDAAEAEFLEPHRGHEGATTFFYDIDYFSEHASIDHSQDVPVVDRRAVSSWLPVDLVARRSDRWPSFLLDLMPQGLGRAMACAALGIAPLSPSSELPLLAAVGGSPVGNVRIAGAPVGGIAWEGLPVEDVLEGRDDVTAALRTIPTVAPAAICLQGEWPKVALVEDGAGLFHPEGCIPDEAVAASYILKFPRKLRGPDPSILTLEAIYMDVAAAAGLHVHARPRLGKDCLLVPRFDRERGGVRDGQESLVSASGIAGFGHQATHEDYIATIARTSSDVAADISEYVARDLVNLAFGNPDNHGRNAALSRPSQGGVRLSPLFDFAPMSSAGQAIRRSTNWACTRGRGSDHDPDWSVVVEAACAAGHVDEAPIMERLLGVAESIPALARKVTQEAPSNDLADHALRRADEVASGVARTVRLS